MIQNDNFYLAEAFNRLSLLNEDAFDLSADKGVVDELQSFVADDIEAPYEEEIIDIAAEDEEELQDNYVGKVILQCDCCHTKIYKDPNEVILDEAGELANVDEECPVCNCLQGWKVIGKIEPFDEEEFKEEEKPEEEEVEVEAEFSDDEIGEALREALNPNEQNELDQIVSKHLTDAAYEAEVDHELDVHRKDMEKAEGAFNDDFYFGDVDESCKNEECKDCKEECDKDLEEKCDESLTEDAEVSPDVDFFIQKIEKIKNDKNEERKQKRLGNLVARLNKCWDELYTIDDDEYDMISKMINDAGFKEYDASLTEEVEPQIKEETSVEDDQKLEDSEQEPIKEELEEVQSEDAEKLVDPEENPVLDEGLKNKITGKLMRKLVNASKDKFSEDQLSAMYSLIDSIENAKSDNDPEIAIALGKLKSFMGESLVNEALNEDVRNISVDVDGTTHVEIEPQDDGGIEVKVDSEGGIEEAPVEDTMIAPLSDEDVAAIEGNNGEVPEEENEFEIDDFDEESFDELGESFLKRVYDNVSSFNTTKVNQNKNQLVVEGLIKFNSGKEKATSFVFENYKNTKRGKVMVEGMNETFSKSNKAFLLKGTLKDKKYTCESLTYNYTASQLNESNENETIRVYGRAVRK